VLAVRIASYAGHLDAVWRLSDGDGEHLDATPTGLLCLRQRPVSQHVGVAVTDDDGDVTDARTITSARREDGLVRQPQSILGVRLPVCQRCTSSSSSLICSQ